MGSCSPALMDNLERAHIRASKLVFKLSRNSVDKTKLSCNTPIDAAPLTVSLETCPLYLLLNRIVYSR